MPEGYLNTSTDEILPLFDIRKLVEEIHQIALEKGWWDNSRTFGDIIALVHSEASEALEEYRDGHSPDEVYYTPGGKPNGIGIELADVVIRIMDYCGHAGIDLQSMIEIKHEYNKARHDKKVI